MPRLDNAISMVEPPLAPSPARFVAGFGQRVLLTVDTEEGFDWNAPFRRDGYSLDAVRELARFQTFCEKIGAHPVYLVDWPIAGDPGAVDILRDAVQRGRAEIGVQLHPWVNPPFDEELCSHNSFAGNLPPALERAKLHALLDRTAKAFGFVPQIYRAGRYGLGKNSAQMLKEAGIAIDTSVRPLFDYSREDGPDYTFHPLGPYWVDEDHALLEVPMTSVYRGMLRQVGRRIHKAQRHLPTFFGGFSRLNLLERIALTPEGVTAAEAIRGIDVALDDGLDLLVLSFHSPTLAPGFTPYARTQDDVERVYDWFRHVFAHLDQRKVRSARVADVLQAAIR